MYWCFLARRSRCSTSAWESFAFFIRSSAFLAIMCLDNHVSMCLGAILLHADLLWLVPDQSCGGHMHACVLALVCASVGAIQGQWGQIGWSITHACKQCCSIKMVCTPCKFQDALLCTLYHPCTWQVKSDMLMQHLWRDVGVLRSEPGCWEDGVKWGNYGEFAVKTHQGPEGWTIFEFGNKLHTMDDLPSLAITGKHGPLDRLAQQWETPEKERDIERERTHTHQMTTIDGFCVNSTWLELCHVGHCVGLLKTTQKTYPSFVWLQHVAQCVGAHYKMRRWWDSLT